MTPEEQERARTLGGLCARGVAEDCTRVIIDKASWCSPCWRWLQIATALAEQRERGDRSRSLLATLASICDEPGDCICSEHNFPCSRCLLRKESAMLAQRFLAENPAPQGGARAVQDDLAAIRRDGA